MRDFFKKKFFYKYDMESVFFLNNSSKHVENYQKNLFNGKKKKFCYIAAHFSVEYQNLICISEFDLNFKKLHDFARSGTIVPRKYDNLPSK